MDSKLLDYSVKYGDETELESRRAILHGLIGYNEGHHPTAQPMAMNIYVKNPEGKVIGGLLGAIWMEWLHVEIFWIDEPYRGKDVGTRIIGMAEKEALSKGCAGIYLDTFSFQARGFYEKLGYTQFGQIDNFPPGHKRYFFHKNLKATD